MVILIYNGYMNTEEICFRGDMKKKKKFLIHKLLTENSEKE
jgi:hypothetical protein